jgi:hypothetical protein
LRQVTATTPLFLTSILTIFIPFQLSFTLTVQYTCQTGPRDPGGTVSYIQTSPERRVISRCFISCPYLFSFPRSLISFPGWTSPERRVSFKLAQSGGPTKTGQSGEPWFPTLFSLTSITSLPFIYYVSLILYCIPLLTYDKPRAASQLQASPERRADSGHAQCGEPPPLTGQSSQSVTPRAANIIPKPYTAEPRKPAQSGGLARQAGYQPI